MSSVYNTTALDDGTHSGLALEAPGKQPTQDLVLSVHAMTRSVAAQSPAADIAAKRALQRGVRIVLSTVQMVYRGVRRFSIRASRPPTSTDAVLVTACLRAVRALFAPVFNRCSLPPSSNPPSSARISSHHGPERPGYTPPVVPPPSHITWSRPPPVAVTSRRNT